MPGLVEMIQLRLGHSPQSEFLNQVVKNHAMQVVYLRPGQLSAAHLVHGWPVPAAPTVGEATPVDVIALARSQQLPFPDDGGTPVNHGAEHVEDKGADTVGHGSLGRSPAGKQAETDAGGYHGKRRHESPATGNNIISLGSLRFVIHGSSLSLLFRHVYQYIGCHNSLGTSYLKKGAGPPGSSLAR